jgi:large subunit ribosomal protein L22
MKAYLKNYRQSPRKVRLIADFIRGKKVIEGLAQVKFLNKRAAGPIIKLIESASSNASNNFGIKKEDLFVKEIQVNKGFTLKRWRARAFGRAHPIHKHASNITVILESKQKDDSKEIKKS